MAASEGKISSIVTVILLVTSTLAVSVRLFVKWSSSHKFHADDALAVGSLICSIGSGVAVVILGENGLSYPYQVLAPSKKEVFAKSLYAANLLYIITLGSAKLSIIALFNLVTIQRAHKWVGASLAMLVTFWSLSSFIAAAFTCTVPRTWDIWGQCYEKAIFWYVFSGINIATDVALIIFPIGVMVPLQMSWSRKAMVLGCFGVRIFDIALSIVQLHFTSEYNSANFTQEIFPWVLMAQLTQCVTIITSCVPYLRPLLESLPSGMFMSDEIRRRGGAYAEAQHYLRTSDNGYILQSVGKDASRQKPSKSLARPDATNATG